MISAKQKKILAFPYSGYDALICDGAVRSGKTSLMVVAFIDWAMREFDRQRFGICGKTVGSAVENMVIPYISMHYAKKRYTLHWRRSQKILEVRRGRKVNYFEVFGGRDESSFALIQGRTLAGVLLDEVVLMPESFVNQALARCSVEGAKLWFSCNPGNPGHWFKQNWIDQREDHNALYLHFEMTDNPSLSEKTLARYQSMYSGMFYDRYIRGLWVAADGLIYDMFSPDSNIYDGDIPGLAHRSQRYIACDYGTTNPCVFLDIYDDGNIIRVDREYRWDSRRQQRQKSDQDYVEDFMAFMGEQWCTVLADPSAASFIVALQQRGVYVQPADNAVLDGIRRTGVLFQRRRLLINSRCEGLVRELQSYVWDEKAARRGEDCPLKQQDHGPDALRYFVNYLPDWRFDAT